MASTAFGQDFESNDDCQTQIFRAGKAIPFEGKTIPLNGWASTIVSADFNNDGKRDIASGLFNSSYTWVIEISLGDGNGNFTVAETVSSFNTIISLTIADFNADGNLDLLATHGAGGEISNLISLLTGDGTGKFVKTLTIPLEGRVSAGVAGDFNNDDHLDFAVTNNILNTVTVYFNDGSGSFPESKSFPVGVNPNSVAKADFNGDERADLIVSNTDSPFVTVLLSAPNGGFNPPVSVPIAENTNAEFVLVGDVNNDGKVDAVVRSAGNDFSGTSILISDGAGKLTLQPFINSSGKASRISLSDLNNDGNLDIIDGAAQGASAVRLGKGDGTFGDELTFASAGFVGAQTVDDFNGDGKADLVQVAGAVPEFQIFFGAGDGRFGPPAVQLGGRPNSSAVADFNQDGKPDLAVSNYELSNVSILTNDGIGDLTVTDTIPLPQKPYAIFTGDFNGDGKQDLGTINQYEGMGAGGVSIILNKGGSFSEPSLFYNGFGNPFRFLRAVAVGDITGDGILDLVIASVDDRGWLLIQKGNGDGNFMYQQALAVGGSDYISSPWGVAIGDLNKDGKNDLVATASGSVVVFLNSEAGNFSQKTYFPAFSPVGNVAAADLVLADFNGDGILDAAVTNNSYLSPYNFIPRVSILLGDGKGGFLEPLTYQTGQGTASIAAADFNGDQHLDLAFANSPNSYHSNSRVGIFYGDGTGKFSGLRRFVAGRNAFDVSVADFNDDGKLDIATPNYYGGDVSILLNDCEPPAPSNFPSLTISESVTVTETDTGTTNASFTVTLSTPSSRKVSVDFYTAAETAIGPADYQRNAGTLVFEPNEVSKSIIIPVKGDTTDEFDESFNIYLVNPLNASIEKGKAAVNIKEDEDFPPGISIGDVTLTEGSGGTVTAVFPVSLSEISGKPVSVQFAAASGTATAEVDFVAPSGTLSIPAGSAKATINIEINSDTLVEPDETFFVTLTSPVNVTISRAQGVGTILNDDIGGNVQFGSGGAFNVAENAGNAVITITRVNGAASGVVVNYEASDGSAAAGQDYSPVSGSVTFGANETSKTFTIPIINDSLNEEPFESINLSLIGVTGGATIGIPSNAVLNISDDDPLPKIRINNINLNEGNQNSLTAELTVNLLAASGRNIEVNFATVDGTAKSPNDYQAVSGTLKFAPGETVKKIEVEIFGDTETEMDETLQISLSSPVNALLDNNFGTITIVNDDFRKNSLFDFDGDGKTDYAIYRPTAGEWWYIRSGDGGNRAFQFGNGTDKIVPADYTGDGKTDVAFFRPSTNEWFILRSEDSSFYSAPFGAAGDVPAPADYDGDGKADIAVFRPSEANWYINRSSGGFSILQFGANGDIPVPNDFDEDGRADLAVYRPGVGEWWFLRSSDGGNRAFQFGNSQDKPVPADYTGDGKTDIAFYRPSTSEWFVLRSEDSSFYSAPFGAEGDVPIPGDYDGDGKADIAVWRQTDTNWYVAKSSGGFSIAAFGSAGDKPVPNAFVP